MTAGKRFAKDMFAPRQSATAWATEAAVFVGICLIFAALFSACAAPAAAPGAPFAELECLAESVAADDAGEELLAVLGPCGRVQVAQ